MHTPVGIRLKGELNVDKKWQSDDLFYIIMNLSLIHISEPTRPY